MIALGRWQRWIIRSIQIQLFVSLISLPFLIGWGLPISILTPISTIMFGPFLTIFLLFSSIIFFSELVYIPNMWFVWCLDLITKSWLVILNCEQQSWLIGFPQPSIILLFAIPGAAAFIIHYKKTNNAMRCLICLALLTIVTCAGLKIFSYLHTTPLVHIACKNKEVIFIHDNNKTILIDPGVIASQASASSWISYTLIPNIIKQTGLLRIDHLIILQPSSRTFEALTELCTKMQIKKLYLPIWTGTLPKRILWKFMKLKNTLQESGGAMIRIHNKPISITLSKKTQLTLEPLTNQLTYCDAQYPAVCVTGTVDNNPLTLYAAKHRKKRGAEK